MSKKKNVPQPIVFACYKEGELLAYASQIDFIDLHDSGKEKTAYIFKKEPKQAVFIRNTAAVMQSIVNDILRLNEGLIDEVQIQEFGWAMVEFMLKENENTQSSAGAATDS
jgi:hypothetical protein